MAVTVAEFKAEYDEFANLSTEKVQAKLNEAYLSVGESWGDLRDVGAKKLAAHLLWISPLAQPSKRGDVSSSKYLVEFERLQRAQRPVGVVAAPPTIPEPGD